MIILATILHADNWSQVSSAAALYTRAAPGTILHYGRTAGGLVALQPIGPWGGYPDVYAELSEIPGQPLTGPPVTLRSGEELPTGGLLLTETGHEWWYAELEGHYAVRLAPGTYTRHGKPRAQEGPR